jgi:hypothetical protein
MLVSWAAHRFSGISSPISPSYSTAELTRQLKAVKCKALFTCATLYSTALEAALAAGIPKAHVYLLEIPEKALKGASVPTDVKSVDQLVAEGKKLSPLSQVKGPRGPSNRLLMLFQWNVGVTSKSFIPAISAISHKN